MTDPATEEPAEWEVRLREWREERQQREAQRLDKWTKSLTAAVACVIPLVGLIWCIVLGLWAEREDEAIAARTRYRALYYLTWALLGCIIWAVIWRIWADDMGRWLAQPFVEAAERVLREAMKGLR